MAERIHYVDEGQRLGRLVVTDAQAEHKHGRPAALCRCDCGQMTHVRIIDLTTGRTRSCGCLKVDTARVNGPLNRAGGRPARPVSQEKRCGGCGRVLALDGGFHADASKPDGHASWCKDCAAGAQRQRQVARYVALIQDLEVAS